MLRRIVMAICFGYLLLAFAFIALVMFNATVLDNTAFVSSGNAGFLNDVALINASDTRVISVLCGLGLVATGIVALRMMLDSRNIAYLKRRSGGGYGSGRRDALQRSQDLRDVP